MSIEGLLAGLVIIGGTLLFVGLPLLRRDAGIPIEDVISRQRERLTVYYDRVLQNIHDLDEDFATGKLDEAEYTVERELWVQRGIEALKAIDEIDAEHLVTTTDADNISIDEAINDSIEQAVTAYRQRALED